MAQIVCIFGDSIVRGHADYQSGGWAQQLQRYGSAEDLFSVYPLGISGDTTTDVIERCDVEMRARDANSVIYAIGINDAARWDGVLRTPQEQFKKNILTLHDIARGNGCHVSFVGLTRVQEQLATPVSWFETLHYLNEDITVYDKIIEDFARAYACTYVDMKSVIGQSDLFDGVHPNAEGHGKMFVKIKEYFEDTKM